MMRFELQGHRGARGLFAENTLSGFVAALSFGLDSIELDIAVTADDVAVVVHDPRLNPDLTRDATGTWLDGIGPSVRSLTMAQLATYDVGRMRPGSKPALANPEQQSADGAYVPTLAEVFVATERSGVRIDAELKTDPSTPDLTVSPEAMAAIVVAVADAAGARHRLAVRSFDWRGLAWMQAHHPDIPLAWLTEGDQTPAMVAQAAGNGSIQPTWSPLHRTLERASIAQAHALGLRVVPWTVNEIADIARLVAWGVDGICTDRPDRAQGVCPGRS